MRINNQINIPKGYNLQAQKKVVVTTGQSRVAEPSLISPSFCSQPIVNGKILPNVNFNNSAGAFKDLIQKAQTLSSSIVLKLIEEEQKVSPKTPVMEVVANYFMEEVHHSSKQLVNLDTIELMKRMPSVVSSLLKNGTLKQWLSFYVEGENSDIYIKLMGAATNILMKDSPDKMFSLLKEREGSFINQDNNKYFYKYLKSTYAQLKEYPEFIDILDKKAGFCRKFGYEFMAEYLDNISVYTKLLQSRKLDNLYSDNEIINIIEKSPKKEGILDLPIDENGSNILLKFAEVVPNEGNQKAYEKAIEALRTLKKLNLNQKDFMGISFFEKAMNSENESLLKFVRDYGRNVEYDPVLDVAFNKMSDKSKKVAKETDMRFVDIEDAINCRSSEALSKLEFQLDSPLMTLSNLNKLIKRLLSDEKLQRENPVFRNKALDFFAKYITEKSN